MKKILSLAAILFAAMLLLTACEKHAFTTSTNIFRYSNGGITKTVYPDLSLKAGKSINIFATTRDGERFETGTYTISISEPEDGENPHCISAAPGEYKGMPCIVMRGEQKGTIGVTLNFYINDFHLYKSVDVTVK